MKKPPSMDYIIIHVLSKKNPFENLKITVKRFLKIG